MSGRLVRSLVCGDSLPEHYLEGCLLLSFDAVFREIFVVAFVSGHGGSTTFDSSALASATSGFFSEK